METSVAVNGGTPREQATTQNVEVDTPADWVAKVTIGGGMTHPTVPFGNVKIWCEVSLPCHVEDVQKTRTTASQIVGDWIADEYELATGEKLGG